MYIALTQFEGKRLAAKFQADAESVCQHTIPQRDHCGPEVPDEVCGRPTAHWGPHAAYDAAGIIQAIWDHAPLEPAAVDAAALLETLLTEKGTNHDQR